jgi:hypothetical protein
MESKKKLVWQYITVTVAPPGGSDTFTIKTFSPSEIAKPALRRVIRSAWD